MRFRDTTILAATRGSFPYLVLCYAALFAAFGTEAPFFPAFLREKGLQPVEIGTLLSAGTLVRLSIGPFLGSRADRIGRRRMLVFLSPCAGVLGLAYLAGIGYSALLVIALIHSAALAALNPLADAMALNASQLEGNFAYGWVRGSGSAAFVTATLMSGLMVGAFGLSSVIVVSSIFFVLMSVPLPGIADVGRRPGASTADVTAGFRALFAIPMFRRILLVAGLIIGSQAMSDSFAVIHWRDSGVPSAVIGALWAEAVLSEVLVFVVLGPALLKRFGAARCATGSALSGLVQWGALATTASPTVLCMTQPLHGFTFALTHLACMQVIGASIPADRLATAQTLYGTLSLGVASAVLTFLSGEAWSVLGAHAFWIMAGLSLLAAPLAWGLPSTKPSCHERRPLRVE